MKRLVGWLQEAVFLSAERRYGNAGITRAEYREWLRACRDGEATARRIRARQKKAASSRPPDTRHSMGMHSLKPQN